MAPTTNLSKLSKCKEFAAIDSAEFSNKILLASLPSIFVYEFEQFYTENNLIFN